MRGALAFLGAFAAILIASHLSVISLPFHWDEMGQFVPAALDIYKGGHWIPVTTVPNVHPPLLMGLLAGVWKLFGYSIALTRMTMLIIASLGVWLAFLLAVRLSRPLRGTPAFMAVVFLLLTPLFYTQSMMVLLDMPAMVVTCLALLLFLTGRAGWSALACVALVLTKETSISTPLVLGGWLWMEGRKKESLWFGASAIALALWLVILHASTGQWFGSAEFSRYNIDESLSPLHVLLTVLRRVWYLGIADGRFFGVAALVAGWSLLKTPEWKLAGAVALAQTAMVTLLGGAGLERYLLPVLPIFYAAIAAAATAYPNSWRNASHAVMCLGLMSGWIWSPFGPHENSLAMLDLVHLHEEAAGYLAANAKDAQILTAWPFSDALTRPEMGYVYEPLHVVRAPGQHLTELASADPHKAQYLAVFTDKMPLEGSVVDWEPIRNLLRKYTDYQPQVSPEEVRAGLGFTPILSWNRHAQHMRIYARTD